MPQPKDDLKYYRFKFDDDDAEELTLAYDFNTIVDVEEICGCNLFSALLRITGEGGGITAAELRGLFFAALEAGPEAAFPGLSKKDSLKETGKLLRVDRLGIAMAALANAYNVSMGNEPKSLDELLNPSPSQPTPEPATAEVPPPASPTPNPEALPVEAAASG